MSNGFLLLSFVGFVSLCDVARAEIFEVPLPEVTGDYPLNGRRGFSVNLGFELTEIRDVRYRIEGSIVAPWASGPFVAEGPENARFHTHLEWNQSLVAYARGPSAGKVSYPEPEAFVAEVPFVPDHSASDWSFLKSGTGRGSVFFTPVAADFETVFTGGHGTITAASLIIDGTIVPEVSATYFLSLMLWPLLKRHHLR